MGALVRPVREADAAAVAALLNAIVRAGAYTVMTEATAADQLAFIRALPTRGVYHVALDEGSGRVLGVQDVLPLAGEPDVGEISTFVALEAHRRGVGKHLCAATFAAARALGFRALRATIRADNRGAVAFYRAQGFELVGILPRYAFVNGRYVDAVLVERGLRN